MAIMLYLEKKYDDDHVFSWPSSDPKADNLGTKSSSGPLGKWVARARCKAKPITSVCKPLATPKTSSLRNQAIPRRNRSIVPSPRSRPQRSGYLVGDGKGKYSLADMIIFPWALWYRFAGIKHEEVGPNVKAWIERIKERPAVKKGLEVPSRSELLSKLDDPTGCLTCLSSKKCLAKHKLRCNDKLLPSASYS